MMEFAHYVRKHVGESDTNEVPLLGILDAYGLTGADRDEMISELHKLAPLRPCILTRPYFLTNCLRHNCKIPHVEVLLHKSLAAL